ncbi:MAG: hypothetical protein DRG83_00560 [Deltaproteobacteria bacterium]|nr:MAG: hypothetical protein DRG83_00560 [Deltaproteobacteria bacterium]
MKFLLIHYSFEYPTSPRAIRWRALVNYFIQKDIFVDVVCADFGSEYENKNIRNLIRIHRTRQILPVKMKRVLNRNQILNKKRDLIKKYFKIVLKRFYDITWKKIYWPDSACLWYFPALYRSIKLLRENDYDILITVAPPFTTHLIGLTIKKFIRLKIKWLADYGDPFAFTEIMSFNNTRLYRNLNYLVESKVVHDSDLISVTTDETRRLYLEKFKISDKKIFTAPPLISDFKYANDEIRINWKEGIHCVFTGRFYKTIRNPDGMLKIFSLLINEHQKPIYLHIYGDTENVDDLINYYKEKLRSRLLVHGEVSKNIAEIAVNSADFLINISNISKVQLPSKVIEYMSTGKPIINFSITENDISSKILQNYPLHIIIRSNNDPKYEAERLSQFIIKNKGKKVSEKQLKEMVKPYLTSSVGEIYLKNIKRVINPKH